MRSKFDYSGSNDSATIVVNLLTGSAVESIFRSPASAVCSSKVLKAMIMQQLWINDFYSAFYILVVMIVDILYSVIDPRIRIQGNKDE